jgi:peptide/nickel transport system permease protein
VVGRFAAKRVVEALFVIWAIMTINFFLVRFMPGDPVVHIIGEDEYQLLATSSPEAIEQIRVEYGLDRSLPEQYGTYLHKTATLDFGSSYRNKQPVLDTILFRMRWTLPLALVATLAAACLGGMLGLRAGYHPKKLLDKIVTPLALVISTIPSNCLAIIFLLIFSFHLGWFPIGGVSSGGLAGAEKALDVLWHMALPAIILILYKASANFMLMKSTMLTIKEEAYVTTAVSKGLSGGKVIAVHLARNALGPFVTSVCMQFGSMFAGAMMVEIVFSWKGMGTLIYDSVTARDYPMLHTSFLIIGVCVVSFNMLADLICAAIDPRIREGIVHEQI